MFKKSLAVVFLSCALAVSAMAVEVPMDAKLDYNQGIDFYKLGMYERAMESFRSAIRTSLIILMPTITLEQYSNILKIILKLLLFLNRFI